MGWIPGWESIQATGWWSGFFFWASIISLIGLGISEVASHRYSERRDELLETQQRIEKEQHDDDIARLHLEAAKANAETAKANEAAAKANERAAEAEVAFIKFRKPRSTLLTLEVRSEMTEKLRPFAGTKFDIGYATEDREQADFLWWLLPTINDAGWVHIDWVGGMIFKRNNWPGDHLMGVMSVINISIEVHPESRNKLQPAADALVAALQSIEIDATTGDFNNSSTNKDAIHLLVGPKR
jgi:hypothetical protein